MTNTDLEVEQYVQAVMHGDAADYVIDLLNTEIDSLREQLSEHGNSNPTGCTKACSECRHWGDALRQAEEAYDALRGDRIRSNRTDNKYQVFVTVQKPDGTETHHAHTYDNNPLLIGLEADSEYRKFLIGDMATSYGYWCSVFSGDEFPNSNNSSYKVDFNFLNGEETPR